MVDFFGLDSVLDRTLFTNKGPIVKRALDVFAGADLRVLSETGVEILSGSFDSSFEGKLLVVSGSPSGRNDGTFVIDAALSSTRLRLRNASFNLLDEASTVEDVIALVNDLKKQYGLHRTRLVQKDGALEGVHGTGDTINLVTAPDAYDLASSIFLANDLRAQINAHVVDVSGDPKVHVEPDDGNIVLAPVAADLPDVIVLVNEMRRRYEEHRQSQFFHQNPDLIDRVQTDPVKATVGTYPGPLTGPFSWTVKDPRLGQVADDPFDVEVLVNGSPAVVDAVFGLLGAVVLASKPGAADTVEVSYDHVTNPPARYLRLNTFEFLLNQDGMNGLAGFPEHRYRARSHLIGAETEPTLSSAFQPLQRGWKYKAYERRYSAVLNDPTTLLLNVPSNKVSFPVLAEETPEVVIRYDPATLPQDATDPWTLKGAGTFSLAPGGSALTIVDSIIQTGSTSEPPFFSHAIDTAGPDLVTSGAFRVRMSEDAAVFEPDGVFSGVCFGLSDGQRAAVAGLLLTAATGLSSAIVMANDAKAQLNAHLVAVAVHSPEDPDSSVGIVDATDLGSLVILVNALKASLTEHFAKGGGTVHVLADGVNVPVLPDATDLDGAVALVNEIRASLNAHGTQAGVHYVSDSSHQVSLVKQIGILTNRGPAEFASSWESFATDWTEYVTYRLFGDESDTFNLFLSGEMIPGASVAAPDLPSLSDIDARMDLIRQSFFGSIGRESKSSSDWQFIRVDVLPTGSVLREANKQVDYDGSVFPELDGAAPWILYGHGGTERILSPDLLQIDSTASATQAGSDLLGLVSGAYRGYTRLEPILGDETASIVEFRVSADYWTQGLSNKAIVLVQDDGVFTVQMAFLQFSPSAATVTGTVAENFVLVTGDTLILRVGNEPSFTVTFSIPPDANTAASVAAKINSVAGFTFASVSMGRVKLTSEDLGASASFTIVAGSALAKLGFSPGVYIGRDSNPEPKLSWFGANLPDADSPTWLRVGDQDATMLGRILRLTDASVSDYISYTLTDPLVTNQVFDPTEDWKVDCRITVLSLSTGSLVPGSGPYLDLFFGGALISVDEGADGKNLELHLSQDAGGVQYLNLLSFNGATNSLDVKSQYAFSWNDGQPHTYNVYTSKDLNSILVLADGMVLTPWTGPSPTYTGLNAGVSGPSISFGSGTEPVTGVDMRATMSVVDWESVSAFRDSKIGDATASSRRYVGIFAGGDPALLSSYYLHQIDWSVLHTYRIIRDPVTGVQVYVDGAATPAITVAYDSLRLPPASSSYLAQATEGRSAISFGCFSPAEITRTRWDFIRYSMGRITLTDRLVPPRNRLNQANIMASPEHLRTPSEHEHQNTTVYSGGTPIDEFMADPDVGSFTNLHEGTPPVPMTQDLESRGGLVKIGTPQESVDAVDASDAAGYLSNLEDDLVNVADDGYQPTSAALSEVIDLANEEKAAYNAHRTEAGVHAVDDVTNVVTAADATDLATAILLLNDIKAQHNAHLVEAGVHVPDGVSFVTAADATDLLTAVALVNDIRKAFSSHIGNGEFHVAPDALDVVTAPDATDLLTAAVLADTLADSFSAHALALTFHELSDAPNGKFASGVAGIGTGTVDGLSKVTTDDALDPGQLIRFVDGPNDGQEKMVLSQSTATEYQMDSGFILDDPTGSRFVRLGFRYLSEGTAATGAGFSTISVTGDVPPFELGDAFMFLEGPNAGAFRNVTAVGVGTFEVSPALPVPDATARQFSLVTDPTRVGVDGRSVVSVSNLVKTRYGAHLTAAGVHRTDDILNSVSSPVAVVLADTFPLLTEIKADLNAHLSGFYVHMAEDTANQLILGEVNDPLVTSLASLNSVRASYLAHAVQLRVHLAHDTKNVVVPAPATDEASGIELANALKREFNRHLTAVLRIEQQVHSMDDLVNTVVAADATDLASLADLTKALADAYNAHRTEAGVHGSTLFIRLEPPSRVLYEGIQFWEFDQGSVESVLYPFSDDETLYFRQPLNLQGTQQYDYTATVAPENDDLKKVIALANDLKASMNAHRTEAGVHPTDDTVNSITSPDATDLPSALTLLAEIKAKLNSHLVEAGVHVTDDIVNTILTSDPTVLKMAVATVIELRQKYVWHRQSTDYHLIEDNVNATSSPDPEPVADKGWILTERGAGMASFLGGAVRMTAAGGGVTYAKANGIPDAPSLRLEFEARLKVASFVYDPEVETGLYAGFVSSIGPGVAAGIGFDALSNIPYVKVQDVNANKAVLRIPFDWSDGAFHTYRLVRDPETDNIILTIVS